MAFETARAECGEATGQIPACPSPSSLFHLPGNNKQAIFGIIILQSTEMRPGISRHIPSYLATWLVV